MLKTPLHTFLFKLLVFIATAVCCSNAQAQLYSDSADYRLFTSYNGKGVKQDTIFVFNKVGIDTVKWGRLVAVGRDTTVKVGGKDTTVQTNGKDSTYKINRTDSIFRLKCSIKLYLYNPITGKFDPIAAAPRDTNKFVFEKLGNGGYKVVLRYTASHKKDSAIAWVFINKIPERLEFIKSADGGPYYKFPDDDICNLTLRLKDNSLVPLIKHYNTSPKSLATCYTDNNIQFKWTILPNAQIPVKLAINKFYVDKPPTKVFDAGKKDTIVYKYILSATTCGKDIKADTMNYKPKATLAKFKVLFRDSSSFSDTAHFLKATKPYKRGAELQFKIENNSENGVKFTWKMKNTDTVLVRADTIRAPFITTDTSFLHGDTVKAIFVTTDTMQKRETIFKFQKPAPYIVYLTSVSPFGCVSSIADTINVLKSRFEQNKDFDIKLPNVIVYKGALTRPLLTTKDLTDALADNKLRFFPVKDTSIMSIKTLQLIIFDRWGKTIWDSGEMYNLGDDFIGWDGTMNNDHSNVCTPGCYYYTYKVEGWGDLIRDTDGHRFYTLKGSGFVYLYHSSQY